MVKFVVAVRRKPGMSAEEFHRYWRENHGPLVRSVPEFMRHVRRYVQSHTLADAASGFPAGGGSFDGYAELWFDDVESVRRAFQEPRYLEVIRPDEPKFADLSSCVVSVTEEVVIHAG
jgi:uncharacterized protein (TIGR02118 family)